MIAGPIFLVICMHIESTRLLENGAFNLKFNKNRRLHIGFTSLDWNDSIKIEETIIMDKNDKDKVKDSWERNK